MTKKDLLDLDKKHIWHPCSQMSDYEKFPINYVAKGEGVWLVKDNGEKILDAISSWWCNLFGHSNKYISEKIKEQLDELEHVIFTGYTHPKAIELAVKLSGLFDNKLQKIFYTDNGSSSVEAALKMSYHYWYNKGKTQKKYFAYLKGAYHGETLGALSVGAIDEYKKIYGYLLPKTFEAEGPDCFHCPYELTRDTCSAECFSKTEKLLEKNYKQLACVIVEPIVQGASGMRIYSPVFLKKLRDKCTELNIHLICDEIAVGFGRTGKMMASHHADIVPDLVTVSKGLTGGFMPMAAVLTSNEIFDAFYAPYVEQKAFMHSHTYSGNPLSCAAACAVFDLFERLDVLTKNIEKGKYIREKVQSLLEHKNVGEIRTIGMITAIELVQDKNTKKAFDWKERIGHQIYRCAEKKGVLLRSLGDVIYFIPPYIITNDEIDFMTKVAIESINEVLK